MRKYLGLNCRRRPNVDPLESRCLLSGVIEVIEVHPAPAFISGIDIRQTQLPVNGFGSLAISSDSSGQENWPMPGFHHDFTPMGGLSNPDVGFHNYADTPVVFALISPNWESENAAVSTPNSESMAAVPSPQNHGDVPPGSPPLPGQPPFLMFLSGDLDRILHAPRDLPTSTPLGETALNSAEGTSQADDVTVSPPTGNQLAVQAQGGNPIGQIAPSGIVSPGNLTALFKPAPEHDDQSIRVALSGESPGNQPVQAVLGNPPTSGLANLVTTDSAADVVRRGADVSTSVVDPISSGNQSKLLLPQAAGLIANAVPFDQAALAKAVDQFFDQLESLGMGQLVEHGPTRVIPLSLALLGTAAAVEVARRRLKSRADERKGAESQNPLSSEELLGYPELPGSWSTNLT